MSRGADEPRLRLVGGPAPRGNRPALALREASPSESRAATERLLAFLRRCPPRLHAPGVRLLDFSPASLPVHAALMGQGVRLTRLAESEVAGELIREADPGAEVVVCPLEHLSTRFSPGSFDSAHSALSLGHRRELPLLAALSALARAGLTGFIWTDRVRQPTRLNARRVRELASRVDLAQCAYRRPLASGLFTLSGWW